MIASASPPQALVATGIFDGARRRANSAVLIEGGVVLDVVSGSDIPARFEKRTLTGLLAPGFIDAQVNGGGGVMLNDDPSAKTMGAIAKAHRRFGTTGLLPTLITDKPAASAKAIAAAAKAVATEPGVIGLHLEGPHLAPSRKGAHLDQLMRPLTAADVDQLLAARAAIDTLLVTLAVEQAPAPLIRRLAEGGVIVSIGHSEATYDEAMAAFDAGARGVTHLFNAMSPLGHRAPGLVGAAIDCGAIWPGIIADGHHVHQAVLAAAIRAKRAPGRCFLVTDAMPSVGGPDRDFTLSGRRVIRRDGRLQLEDGTLAGSDIDMASALRFAIHHLDIGLEEALRMASLYPAMFLKRDDVYGRIAPAYAADFVLLDTALHVIATWVGGVSTLA